MNNLIRHPPSCPALFSVEAFNFRIRMSSPNGKGSFRIVSGGSGCDYYTNDISGLVSVPDTGDYDNLMEMKV